MYFIYTTLYKLYHLFCNLLYVLYYYFYRDIVFPISTLSVPYKYSTTLHIHRYVSYIPILSRYSRALWFFLKKCSSSTIWLAH